MHNAAKHTLGTHVQGCVNAYVVRKNFAHEKSIEWEKIFALLLAVGDMEAGFVGYNDTALAATEKNTAVIFQY